MSGIDDVGGVAKIIFLNYIKARQEKEMIFIIMSHRKLRLGKTRKRFVYKVIYKPTFL